MFSSKIICVIYGESEIVEPTNFLLRELEQRNSVGGESSYGLNGHVIPAERQQLPDFGFVIDIILNVSHISDRDSTSPEEMDYASDSSCMERDDGSSGSINAEFINDIDE